MTQTRMTIWMAVSSMVLFSLACSRSHQDLSEARAGDAATPPLLGVACGDLTCDADELCVTACYAGDFRCVEREDRAIESCSDLATDPCVGLGFGVCAGVDDRGVSCACAGPEMPVRDICSPSPEEEPPPGECACGFEWLPHPEAGNCYTCLACPECPEPGAVELPDAPEEFTLSWTIRGGDSGSGPLATVDDRGFLTIDWDLSDAQAEPEIRRFVGTNAVRELLALVLAVDSEALPHGTNRAECTADLMLFPCGPDADCVPSMDLRYGELRQVMPELHCVAKWFERYTDGRPWSGACEY